MIRAARSKFIRNYFRCQKLSQSSNCNTNFYSYNDLYKRSFSSINSPQKKKFSKAKILMYVGSALFCAMLYVHYREVKTIQRNIQTKIINGKIIYNTTGLCTKQNFTKYGEEILPNKHSNEINTQINDKFENIEPKINQKENDQKFSTIQIKLANENPQNSNSISENMNTIEELKLKTQSSIEKDSNEKPTHITNTFSQESKMKLTSTAEGVTEESANKNNIVNGEKMLNIKGNVNDNESNINSKDPANILNNQQITKIEENQLDQSQSIELDLKPNLIEKTNSKVETSEDRSKISQDFSNQSINENMDKSHNKGIKNEDSIKENGEIKKQEGINTNINKVE